METESPCEETGGPCDWTFGWLNPDTPFCSRCYRDRDFTLEEMPMFTIHTETGSARLESIQEATTYLEALTPGAEVTVQGLGRLVVLRGRGRPVLFYPMGRATNPQDMLLEDVVAMLPEMVA